MDDRKVSKFIREIMITKCLGTRLQCCGFALVSMQIQGDPDPGQTLKSQKVEFLYEK